MAMIGSVVSHYEILAQIGKGGMGVVYKARDRSLDRLVALKFLPRELAESTEKKQRFLQEARAASALDHPNICTVHEIGETQDGQLFIAMAHYEGETLKDKVARGPLPVADVLDLAEQLAAGLDAAHKRGLTHLDIKPANVLVTSRGVVKILDFGLAQFSGEAAELSSSGAVMGTVSYMAPERVLGQEVTPQTDIWAMGAVLYEMVTGQKPFQGLDKTEVLYAIVRDDIKPPSECAEDVPAELDEIIGRALTKDQSERYQTMQELAQDLDQLLQERRASDLSVLPGRWWLRMGRPEASMAAAAAIVVFLIWWTFKALVMGPPELDGSSGVLFLGFDNRLGPESGWVATALEESLFMMLPGGERLQWMRAESESFPLDAATRSHLLSGLDSERGLVEKDLEQVRTAPAVLLVGGICRRSGEGGEMTTVDLVAQDLSLGAVVKKLSVTGRSEDFQDLVHLLVTPLAKAFGIDSWETPPALGLPAADSKAAHLLFLGRGKMQRLDAAAARQLYVESREEAGWHPEIHLALIDALLELGRDQDAAIESQMALKKTNLPMETQARFTARLLQARGETLHAAPLLRAFWEDATSSKDADASEASFEEGLHLAQLLVSSGDLDAAGEITARLWARSPGDARLALVDAATARHLWLFPQQETAAQMALRLIGEKDGYPWLQARALLIRGQARLSLHRVAEAELDFREARQIYASHDAQLGVARVLGSLAGLDLARHDLNGAKELYESSIRICEELGNRRFLGWPLAGRAVVARQRGDLPAAFEDFRRSLKLLKGAVDPFEESQVLLQLGESAMEAGRLQEAEQSIQRVLALPAEESMNARHYEAEALSSLGELQRLRGDLLEADQTLLQAAAIQRRAGDLSSLALTLSRHAAVYHHRGQLDEAGRFHQEALKAAAESGDLEAGLRCRRGFAETLLASGRLSEARSLLEADLAQLGPAIDPLLSTAIRLTFADSTLAGGDPVTAEAEVRAALDALGSEIALVAAEGHRLLAECLFRSRRFEEARREIDSALAKLPPEIAAERLGFKLMQAKILTERGEVEPARQILADLLTLATTSGFAESELEIQVALASIDLATGSQRSARSHLTQIEKEATLKGFLRIAAEARRIRP